MGKKRRGKRRGRSSRKPSRPHARGGGIQLTTPEGAKIVFTSAHYRNAAM